jgi:hypothetical protein
MPHGMHVYRYTMNKQIQMVQENKTLDKARLIAAAKRVRRSQANRNIWLVGSGNPKTRNKFYCVLWDKELDCFMCDCKAFEFSPDNTCKHVLACSLYEGGLT